MNENQEKKVDQLANEVTEKLLNEFTPGETAKIVSKIMLIINQHHNERISDAQFNFEETTKRQIEYLEALELPEIKE